jgi:hypothetical protein
MFTPPNENIIETKKCRISGNDFVVTDKDSLLYEKLGVPPPTVCPDEFWKNLLGFRNEWNLFPRQCSKT